MDLKTILKSFSSNDVREVFIKILSPNDNSKNQIYLGSESFIHILPSTHSSMSIQNSAKENAKEFIFINHICFFWINNSGINYAPDAKIIFYPQYPEVRLSGFLSGAEQAPSDLLGVRTTKRRVLFLGSDSKGISFGRVEKLSAKLLKEIKHKCDNWDQKKSKGVFFKKELGDKHSLYALTYALRGIFNKEWINGCRIKKGKIIPYKASNGGGYTLEAQLGISPNGNSEPDYLGWEVKQHAISSKIITLMTPDPDKGFAAEHGTKKFVFKYGYLPRNGQKNRKNFGGLYRNKGDFHHLTKVKLVINGFKNGKINSLNGHISLIDQEGNQAATWSFEKLMSHWTKKHYKAVFVSSENRPHSDTTQYRYFSPISIGINSRFIKFLQLVEDGKIYLDPALKVETNENGKQEIKTRYQFRVHLNDLALLYERYEEIVI